MFPTIDEELFNKEYSKSAKNYVKTNKIGVSMKVSDQTEIRDSIDAPCDSFLKSTKRLRDI